MQKEEKDSLTTDNKKLRTQRVINQFDGAALLTLRRLTPEELELLVDYVNQHQLGARSVVPATRPQQQQQSETKKGNTGRITVDGNKKKSDEGASS